MRCPECENEGKPHQFRQRSGPSQQGTVDIFWDEKNNHHAHDETLYTTSYFCTNGHHYTRQSKARCPVDGCEWNLRPDVIVKPLHFGP